MRLRHLIAYVQERFPPVNMALFAIVFLTVWSVATHEAWGTLTSFGWREAGGIGATISFFFRLRVFDEIKDYASDARHYPHRVLQSGRVTLRQLGTLAAIGAFLELAWSYRLGTPALVGWLLAVGYSLLMRYEFFAHGFLARRLALYAFTHLLIMPLVIAWLWRAYNPVLSPRFALLGALSLLGGGAFELARKIHAPEAERAGIDSYSQALGYRPALTTVLVVLLVGVGVQRLLLDALAAGSGAFWVLIVPALGAAFGYLRAWSTPSESVLRQNERLVSLFLLLSYLGVVAVVWVG
jgi:hypothetical protein